MLDTHDKSMLEYVIVMHFISDYFFALCSLFKAVDVGPENRTVISDDNFLRVNLVGDFAGYTSILSFEDFYLVTPRLVCICLCLF